MNPTIDIVRGELERLFTLEEMTQMSERLLGLPPTDVGGTSAKGSFALALTERCFDGDRIDALVDVILHARKEVDPRVRDLVALLGREDLAATDPFGDFTIQRKIGEGDLGIVYQAVREDGGARVVYALKVLRREASRDRRTAQRFLTANRLVGTVEHVGLPRNVEAGEVEPGVFYVAYRYVEAQSLAAQLSRTGPVTYEELRPILRGILEPLAAVHEAHLVHGDLKAENILVTTRSRSDESSAPNVCLVDFGTDRLRLRGSLKSPNGQGGVLAVYGSPKTVAPEIVRGQLADPRSDVYAFGAVLYELLTGASVFRHESATDAAFAHLSHEPEPPSRRAPRGWVSPELDAFVVSLLEKDPVRRPKDAGAVLDALESMGRAQARATIAIAPARVQELVDGLVASPRDHELALTLEHAVEEGADALRVGDGFARAASQVRAATPDDVEAKKALLYRAARIYDKSARDKARAESTFAAIVNLDPRDEIARAALEDTRKALGKYDELVEMLLAKSQVASSGEERGRALAEIGRLYATELEDPDQAVVAFVRALCEVPRSEEYAAEVERLCGTKTASWSESLETIDATLKETKLSSSDRVALVARVGSWYETRLGRADMALAAYQHVRALDPAHEGAAEGVTGIYRRAQQWPELASVLIARADVTTSAPKARDLRAEAAEVLELRLNDLDRARGIVLTVLADDPGHPRASDAMARLAERTGDFTVLANVLQRRADARRGLERADALVKVAEVYEDRLGDPAEATRRFEAALAIDPANVSALKGLERVASRNGKFRDLLGVLRRHVDVAATPRQKVALYERIAALHDEEFLDHEAAAEACAAVLDIDGAHDGALSALARHYRALQRWEDACSIYERHAAVTSDSNRRVELLLARARTLTEQIGSPERAMKAYEQVLSLEPAHAGALEGLARLRETSGDAHAALSALEALAMKAAAPEARAEQWLRAARLLETRGDRDGAIERYKLALDANPHDLAASAALRKAYGDRGNWLGVVDLVERELRAAQTDLARARLWAELAKVHRAHVLDPQKAEFAAKKSVELDPSNAGGLMVLGDLAFESGRMADAATVYETLIGRAGALAKDDAVRMLVRFIEAFGKTQSQPSAALPSSPPSQSGRPGPSTPGLAADADPGDPGGAPSPKRTSETPPSASSLPPPTATHPRVMAAVAALEELAPQDVGALARASGALFEFGDPESAYRLHQELFKRYDAELVGSERAEALYHLGESARRSGELSAAIAPLREAIDLEPSRPHAYRALAKVHDERGEWIDAIQVRRERLQLAVGSERFELLLEMGDLLFAKLDDRAGASRAYTEALEERPDDRKLLTKLMQFHSEEQNWGKVCDVVVRLADGVGDPRQRAKYMHTAATIASKHLNDSAMSLDFYRRALDFDPTLEKALEEAIELYQTRAEYEQVERLLKTQLEQAKIAQDRTRIVRVLDKLGELYHTSMNEPDLAADAFEAAQAFDPDDRARAERLAEIFAADPGQFLDKAVAAQATILRKNPYRVESYKVLRRLYTDAKRADPAWCLCQALSILRIAEPDEERFYMKHRAESAAPAQASVDDAGWKLLAHWELDPNLTRLFAVIQPTVLRTRTPSIEQLGYDPKYAIDTSMHPYPVSQTLYYVQGVLAMPPVLVFPNPNDPGSLGIVHARTPAIALGRAAFDNTISNPALAFMAGRHLTSFRPGFYVRHLVPTGTGLKAWLFAAIKLCVPQFPVAPDLVGQVTEAMTAMKPDFIGAEKDRLASAVAKLLQAGGALDLKRWVTAIDLTADRVGLLLAHDLQVATEVIRSTEEASSVPVKERMKDIVLFSVSEEYFAIREKLGIAIDA